MQSPEFIPFLSTWAGCKSSNQNLTNNFVSSQLVKNTQPVRLPDRREKIVTYYCLWVVVGGGGGGLKFGPQISALGLLYI